MEGMGKSKGEKKENDKGMSHRKSRKAVRKLWNDGQIKEMGKEHRRKKGRRYRYERNKRKEKKSGEKLRQGRNHSQKKIQ
jgi:hypothetical protein